MPTEWNIAESMFAKVIADQAIRNAQRDAKHTTNREEYELNRKLAQQDMNAMALLSEVYQCRNAARQSAPQPEPPAYHIKHMFIGAAYTLAMCLLIAACSIGVRLW